MAPTATEKSSAKNAEKIESEEGKEKTKAEEKPVSTDNELSEEDKQLKEELELCVQRINDSDPDIRLASLTILQDRIRTATSSLTSVPKPLKMLRPHYQTIVDLFAKYKQVNTKHAAWFLHAEVLSVLGMTNGEKGTKNCLEYRILAETFGGVRPKVKQSETSLEIGEDIKSSVKSAAREQASKGLGSWGHEYVKHLSHEIIVKWNDIADGASEFAKTLTDEEKTQTQEKLLTLVKEIIPFNMAFNAETDACDLLMELDRLEEIVPFIDTNNSARVCLYLRSCEPYVPEGENTTLMKTVLQIHRGLKQFPEAMHIALQLNDLNDIKGVFLECKDLQIQKQLAYILARQHVFLPLTETDEATEAGIAPDDQDDLVEIMSNSQLSSNFLTLVRELDIMEAKTPEDVYKTHLENTRPGYGPSGSAVESARMSLAAAYVNAFVNCGFGKDKMMDGDEGNKFIHRNKDHGMLAATASLGAIQLWDVDAGLGAIDKYLYASDNNIKAGALLGCGIVSAGVRNECDPALALLSDYVSHTDNTFRKGAVFGLGLAYAGSNREDIIEILLSSIVEDEEIETPANPENMDDTEPTKTVTKKLLTNATSEIISLVALSVGLISVGTVNTDVTKTLLAIISQKKEELGKDSWYRYLAFGLALPFLMKQDAITPIVAVIDSTITEKDETAQDWKKFTKVLLDAIAYAGTGNVLKIQNFLHICSEQVKKEAEEEGEKKEAASTETSSSNSNDKEKDKSKSKEKLVDYSRHAAAVLGIGLVAMNEDVGIDMAQRVLGSLLRYGEPVIKKTVPLAFAILCTSNPKLSVLDTLSKLSHDNDVEVAQNAIFAMGLVASGTNNARLAQQCRQLAQYYAKDGSTLFLVRLCQGLIHMGKGTMTLQPYQGDRTLLNIVSLAGLMTTLLAFTDSKQLILGGKNAHYLLYSLMISTQPKLLQTFDESGEPLQINVRVGQAVDTVGQAGRPKTITGFQTRTTPVLLGYGERAQLATDEYIPLSPVLEGFVILRKNPDYEPEDK